MVRKSWMGGTIVTMFRETREGCNGLFQKHRWGQGPGQCRPRGLRQVCSSQSWNARIQCISRFGNIPKIFQEFAWKPRKPRNSRSLLEFSDMCSGEMFNKSSENVPHYDMESLWKLLDSLSPKVGANEAQNKNVVPTPGTCPWSPQMAMFWTIAP